MADNENRISENTNGEKPNPFEAILDIYQEAVDKADEHGYADKYKK